MMKSFKGTTILAVVAAVVTVIAVFFPSSSAKYIGSEDFGVTVRAVRETFYYTGEQQTAVMQPGLYYIELWGGGEETEKTAAVLRFLEETTIYIDIGGAEDASVIYDNYGTLYIESGVEYEESEWYEEAYLPDTERPDDTNGAAVITFLDDNYSQTA